MVCTTSACNYILNVNTYEKRLNANCNFYIIKREHVTAFYILKTNIQHKVTFEMQSFISKNWNSLRHKHKHLVLLESFWHKVCLAGFLLNLKEILQYKRRLVHCQITFTLISDVSGPEYINLPIKHSPQHMVPFCKRIPIPRQSHITVEKDN